MTTNKDVIMKELELCNCNVSGLNDTELFETFCNLHNDDCDGCQYKHQWCPIGTECVPMVIKKWFDKEYIPMNMSDRGDYIREACKILDEVILGAMNDT